MTVKNRNTFKKQSSGSTRASAVIIFMIIAAVAGYYLYRNYTAGKSKPPVVSTSPKTAVINNLPAEKKVHIDKYVDSGKKDKPVLNKKSGVDDGNSVDQNVSGSGRVLLSIIIDDMGSSLQEAKSLSSIHLPLTFAVIPGLRSDRDVAEYASSQKIELLIHMPMQSKGWPARRLEGNGLLTGMGQEELDERVSAFIQRVPGAVGANNHMGSDFTEHEDKMQTVLKSLKRNDLFFVDSITSPESTGVKVAKSLGMRYGRRNVFLDNEQDRGYILGQLRQAVQYARKNGSAIAICHPHTVTIATLKDALPELAGQGVQLVTVSQLLK